MGNYDQIKHDLDTKIIQASSLKSQAEQKNFVNSAFSTIHTAYKQKQVNHSDYIKLINRLANYKQGIFNDYLDSLTGAAQMGMLDIAFNDPYLSPEASRKRRDDVTDMTGVDPIKPEEN